MCVAPSFALMQTPRATSSPVATGKRTSSLIVCKSGALMDRARLRKNNLATVERNASQLNETKKKMDLQILAAPKLRSTSVYGAASIFVRRKTRTRRLCARRRLINCHLAPASCATGAARSRPFVEKLCPAPCAKQTNANNCTLAPSACAFNRHSMIAQHLHWRARAHRRPVMMMRRHVEM